VLPDGDARWLSSRVLVLYGAGGRAEQMIGVSFDVNEEKRAQRERTRLAALERRALRAALVDAMDAVTGVR
jgi:hypothetical protein